MNLVIKVCIVGVTLWSLSCGGLTEKQKTVAEKSISELRKLEAATQIGISKSEYGRMLITAQAAATEANSALPDGALKSGIAEAAKSYADANTLWNIMKDDDWFFACIQSPPKEPKDKDDLMVGLWDKFCPAESSELTKRYNLPKRDKKTKDLSEEWTAVIYKKEALSVVWQAASEKLNRVGPIN